MKKFFRTKIGFASLALLTLLLMLGISFSGVAGEASAAVNNQQTVVNVTIKGFAFNPTPLTIQKGTKVIWTNQDTAAHTVTSDTGTVLNSPLIPTNATFEFTFNETGTFTYHCTPHPNMKASIIVQDGPVAAAPASAATAAATTAAAAPASAATAAPTATTAVNTPAGVPATGLGGQSQSEGNSNIALWLVVLGVFASFAFAGLVARRRINS